MSLYRNERKRSIYLNFGRLQRKRFQSFGSLQDGNQPIRFRRDRLRYEGPQFVPGGRDRTSEEQEELHQTQPSLLFST